jgi:hypothetical protein
MATEANLGIFLVESCSQVALELMAGEPGPERGQE